MANSFNFLEVKFQELTDNVNTWIKDLYNKSDLNLSPASPYGHILQAVNQIYESSILYLKNVTAQFDINNPNNTNAKMVRAMARTGGYNPSRSISATGTIALQLRPGVEIDEIPSGELIIQNGTKITATSNGLDYYIDLGGAEQATYKLAKGKKIYLPVVQGKIEKQTFTGNGQQNQSVAIQLPNDQTAEQFRTVVRVDGDLWNDEAHLYDMLKDQKSWYGRTGIDSGLDVYFGTNDFGTIPQIGDNIEITYIVSDGSLGNIPAKIPDDFTFTDDAYDGFGSTVDIAQNFIIFIEDEIGLGADAETTTFTKAILPYVSRNFVLARPEQYIFMLKRLNVFSQIDAFTTEKGSDMDDGDPNDDSVVYIFLVPNISLFLTGGNSYFDLDLNAFFLEPSEKTKVESYLRTQGILCVGTSLKILDPIITNYVVNVHLRFFEDAIEDNVRAEVLNNLSNFFGNLERRGRIDKSAIIKIIEEIDGVDSVMVDFVSKSNETYHKEFEDFKENVMRDNPNVNPDTIVMDGYEPNKVVGLDPVLGDIIYTKNELPIIRGGWQTRDGVYFNETPQTTGLGSVNIIKEGVSKRSIF
jgi:hypothetical protein